MNLGKTIRALRINKGIKQNELANMCGLTQAYMSLIETNKKTPSSKTLNKISLALDIPIPFILFKSLTKKDIKKEKQKAFEMTQPFFDVLLEKLI